jgi:hypothetical protein
LPYAIAQAQRFDAHLILLKVVPPLLEARSPQMEAQVKAQVEEAFAPIVAEVQAAGLMCRLLVSKAEAA